MEVNEASVFFYLELEHFKFRAQTKPGKEGDLWGNPEGKLCTSQMNMMWKSALLKPTCEMSSPIADMQFLCYSEQAVTEAFVNSKA